MIHNLVQTLNCERKMSTQLTNSNSFSKSSQQIDKSPNVAAIRYQALKLRRAELEKKLNEKYNSLQQICREVDMMNLPLSVPFFKQDFDFRKHNSLVCIRRTFVLLGVNLDHLCQLCAGKLEPALNCRKIC